MLPLLWSGKMETDRLQCFMQKEYDLRKIRKIKAARIRKEVKPLVSIR